LTGAAALPSTVDVLVNNVRRSSQPVQPGPFELNNVPIITGAGQIGLVVRDLQGRETVIQQSYYVAPELLARGLSDFSFEAGLLRTGYGRDSEYGDAFGAATWRQGVSNNLSAEGRVEWQPSRRAGGVSVTSLLGTWGAAYVALAASSGNRQGPPESGQLLQLGIQRSTQKGSGTLRYEQASRGFAPFGEAVSPLAAGQRSRESWLASLGGSLWGPLSGAVSYVRRIRWDGDRVQWLGMSMSTPLWQRATLNASLNKRLDGDQDWSAGVFINFTLDNGIATSAQMNRGTGGELDGVLTAQRNVPAGPGLGWQVKASSTAGQRASGGLQYNSNYFETGLQAVVDHDVAVRAGARGTVGWFEHMPFASRPMGESSVAVVKVDGVPGVSVQRSNQVVAVTNARGLAFVPGLLPWQENLIAIDLVDLPLDVDVASTRQEVTPYARSGVLVDFGAHRSRQALLVLRQPDGTPVPIGAIVRLLPAGPEFMVGRRGEAWLTDLAEESQGVQVSWPQGGCTLTLEVPASPDGTPGRVGPLECAGEKP
jgi:outer membrane usher protein